MAAFESLDAFLFSASRACCSPLAVFIQIQGCCICLLLAFGWACAAYVRNREIRRMKDSVKGGNSFAFLCHDINDLEHYTQTKLPRVSVVMPLKGFGEHNLKNWRSQITSLYGGPLEFLFVVESTEDPAYHAVSLLISDFKDSVDAKIIVAGLSTTCSQKIHNQLVGVERMHKDSKYVLFLDDDVRLHPGSIGALTAEMVKNPEIFIQTGYPLDLPSGSLGSYCIYEYHMPCSMGCATGGRTFFLWGECMMMHADDFRTDLYGMVTRLRDGGYSDDMTLAAISGAHKRLIMSPPVAVFPHPLASDLSFSRYWNYLRKQTFVLESYTTTTNWMMNHVLFSVHCYLSWGFVAPYVMAMIHIAAALRICLEEYPFEETAFNFGGLTLAGCLAVCTVVELLSMWNLTKIEIQLCNMLSPEEPPVSLGSYNWGLIFLAMLVDNFLYAISAIRSHFSESINWSGVRYHLRNGKIWKVVNILSNGASSSGASSSVSNEQPAWPVTKTLSPVDVSSASKLYIPKAASQHIIEKLTDDQRKELQQSNSVNINVRDVDADTNHSLKLVFDGIKHYLKGGWGLEFVKRRGLKEGQEIGLRCDVGQLYFGVLD